MLYHSIQATNPLSVQYLEIKIALINELIKMTNSACD